MSDTQMVSPLASTPDWFMFSALRRRQRASGFFSAIVMTLCLIVLCDGLISQMRGGGSYRIEMLSGTSEAVSGPMADPKAVAGDMEFFPIPQDAPITFEFKGFFSSYWFGTGMWRGYLHASDSAPSGTYQMAIGLRGTPSAAHQVYTVAIAADKFEQDRNSLSFVRRWTSWNPFYLAAILAAFGLSAGVASYMLGRRTEGLLSSLGLSEIFKTSPDGIFIRVYNVTGQRDLAGKNWVAYDSSLRRLGKVIFDRSSNGVTECLFVKDAPVLPHRGDFVAFWERTPFNPSPVRRGFFHGLAGGRKAAGAGADPSSGHSGAGGISA